MRTAFLSRFKNSIKITLPAALISAAVVFYLNFVFDERLIFGVLILSAIAGLGILGAYWKNQDLLEVIIPASLFYLAAFGFRTILVQLEPRNGLYPTGLSFEDYLGPSLILAISGLLFLLLGYFSPLGQFAGIKFKDTSQKVAQTIRPRTLFAASIILFLIGQGARIMLFLQSGGFFIFNIWPDFSATILLFLNIFKGFIGFGAWGVILFWAYFLYWRPSSKTQLLSGIIMTAVELGIALMSGYKTGLFLMVLALSAAFHYLKKRFNIVQLLVLGLLAVLIIFPLVGGLRAGFFATYKKTGSFQEALQKPLLIKEKNGLIALLRRFHGADSLGLAVKYTPDLVPYQNGKTLYPALTAPIPRFLWQGKPVFDYGPWYNQTFWGRPASYTSGIAVYQIGDLYLNFGIPAVLTGLFLMGLLYRFFYSWLIENQTRPLPVNVWIYGLLSFEILKTQESNLALALGNLFNLLAFLAVAVIIMLVLQKWLNIKKW